MATSNWGRLTVVDLRYELKQRGLSTAGKKADLVERLTTAESEQINNSAPTNDHGTEAQMPADTSEVTENDVKYPENLPKVDNRVADNSASIETSELGGKSESVGETEPIAKAEPIGESELFENSERVKDSEQATESNPITESEHVEKPEPAVEPESIEKPEPVTEPDTINNPQPSEHLGPIAKSKLAGEPELIARMEPHPVDSTPAQLVAISSAAKEHKDDAVSTMEVDKTSPDLSRDVRGRKRRSRTPPPSDDESSRKRTRPEQHNTDEIQTADDPALVRGEEFPLDDGPSGKDSSYAKLLPDIPTECRENETSQGGLEIFEEDFGKVPPSIHRPTSALYIRNFMRPLKEQDVRDYLAALATPPGRTPDDSIIQSFFLDKVRSHVFVEFDNVAAAQRTRAQIHTKIWPEESTRKALWADFILPEKIPGWIDVEEKGHSRGEPTRRWELIYEVENGEVKLELIDGNDPENKPRLMGKPGVAIPTGPAKQFSGVEGAPSGPRGHGAFRDPHVGGSRNAPITTSAPGITFTPVSDHVVRHRLHNLRSLQTTNRYRKMGGPGDIFRYTFEYNDIVIDRGREGFVGVWRPMPSRRRDRNRNQHRPRPPGPHDGDRYVGGGRDRFPERDVPRSRFDNMPLPTFRGGGRGGGGGSGGGPRRPHYWNHR